MTPTLLVSQDGPNLKVHDEGIALLNGLGTAPVATVAVAGMYRTGKSFLLNQLVGGNGSFTVGNTTSSCTRGIWICVVPPDVRPPRLRPLVYSSRASPPPPHHQPLLRSIGGS